MLCYFTEKPDAARKLAPIVGAGARHDGYLEGADVVVTWGFGHLVAIDEPEAMNSAWGKPWRTEQLPMIPDAWRYRVLEDAKKQFAVVKTLLADSRFDKVVCATDAGREGERIFRLIYQEAGCKKPIKRLWVSALTEEALRAGVAQLRDGREFEALGRAAEARGRADWLVGLNATRAYTLRNSARCTVGRVQTPTLSLIVRRQREIEAFQPQPYWGIRVRLSTAIQEAFTAAYVAGEKRDRLRIDDKAAAERIARELAAVDTAACTELATQEQERAAPHLYDLSTLQAEANARWGYTAAQVLEAAQELYEKHTAITYPRTASPCLSKDNVPHLAGIITALEPSYPDAVAQARERKEPLGKPYVDDTRLTDHHAIIPTYKPPAAGQLAERDARIYDLVAKRFLAVFLPPKRTAITTAYFSAGEHSLRARGTVVLDPGWTVIYADQDQPEEKEKPDDEETAQRLPLLEQGHAYTRCDVQLQANVTKPPRPYTDGTIIKAMRTAGADLEDKDLRVYMKAAGLGTEATRADIIEKLLRAEYIKREKKTLVATPKGGALVDQVHPDLVDPATTARWEQRLKAIEDGTDDARAFERDIAAFVRQVISAAAEAAPIAVAPLSGLGLCPACRQGMIRSTQKGWGCSRWKEGCSFMIWKQVAGKKLTDSIATQLVTSRRTSRKLSGFKSKAGNSFEARLRLDDKNKVVFEFEK